MAVSAAWFAGFFDGEGSINISPTSKCCLTVKLCVVNTHLPTLIRIQKEFGGSLYARNGKGTKGFKPSYLPCYSLSWNGNNASKVIAQVIAPYVSVKKEQIDFLLNEWFPYAEANKRHTTSGKGYSQEIWDTKAEMVSKLKDIRTVRFENDLLQ